jgi:hypothetical protein
LTSATVSQDEACLWDKDAPVIRKEKNLEPPDLSHNPFEQGHWLQKIMLNV